MAFLYALLVLAATVVGAVTGNGGGLVIKPIMDMVGTFSASEIAILTSCMVFAMSLVSIVSQANSRRLGLYEKKVSQSSLVALILGGVVGGAVGEYVFSLLTAGVSDSVVKLVQNCVFIPMIIFGYVYMGNKDKVHFQHTRAAMFLVTGLGLGLVSAFLGIGGGTLNTACLMLLFSMCIKEAAFCSLSIVLAAQSAKLIFTAVRGGFSVITGPLLITTLCSVIAAGIVGGLLGSLLSSKVSEKTAIKFFYGLQTVILIIIAVNIVRCAIVIA